MSSNNNLLKKYFLKENFSLENINDKYYDKEFIKEKLIFPPKITNKISYKESLNIKSKNILDLKYYTDQELEWINFKKDIHLEDLFLYMEKLTNNKLKLFIENSKYIILPNIIKINKNIKEEEETLRYLLINNEKLFQSVLKIEIKMKNEFISYKDYLNLENNKQNYNKLIEFNNDEIIKLKKELKIESEEKLLNIYNLPEKYKRNNDLFFMDYKFNKDIFLLQKLLNIDNNEAKALYNNTLCINLKEITEKYISTNNIDILKILIEKSLINKEKSKNFLKKLQYFYYKLSNIDTVKYEKVDIKSEFTEENFKNFTKYLDIQMLSDSDDSVFLRNILILSKKEMEIICYVLKCNTINQIIKYYRINKYLKNNNLFTTKEKDYIINKKEIDIDKIDRLENNIKTLYHYKLTNKH